RCRACANSHLRFPCQRGPPGSVGRAVARLLRYGRRLRPDRGPSAAGRAARRYSLAPGPQESAVGEPRGSGRLWPDATRVVRQIGRRDCRTLIHGPGEFRNMHITTEFIDGLLEMRLDGRLDNEL